MPSKFDFGDEKLDLTARPAQAQRVKDPVEERRLRQTLPSTLISLGITIAFYAWLFGNVWIATAFELMIVVHEVGHVLAARRLGWQYLGMHFVPLLGGRALLLPTSPSVTKHAFVGIMGPVFGTVFGVLCLVLAQFSSGMMVSFWLLVARWSFVLNLLNVLIPAPPLDGHWIAAVFGKGSGASRQERITYALAWLGLLAALVLGILFINNQLHT